MRLGTRTLALSVILHGAALVALLRWTPAPDASPKKPQPIALVISKLPRAVPPEPEPEPKPKPKPKQAASKPLRPARANPRKAPPQQEELPAAPAARHPSTAPPDAALSEADSPSVAPPDADAPKVDLFAGVAEAARALSPTSDSHAPAPGDPNAALKRANHSLQALKEDLRQRRSAQVVPRGVKAFGERLSRTFVPDPNGLRHASPLGTGAASMAPHYFDLKERDQDAVRAIARAQNGPRANGKSDQHVGACFGACDGFEHGSAALRVEVVVHHDETGRPRRWSVPQTSGDRSFDAAALASVRDAVETLPDWVDGVPVETHWAFEFQALRWGRMELLLDPGFQAPGREVENGPLGKTTVVQSVRLISLKLAHDAATAPDS